MDKRPSRKKEHDFSVTDFLVVQEATGQVEEVQPDAGQEATAEERHAVDVTLGRLDGKKGGQRSGTTNRGNIPFANSVMVGWVSFITGIGKQGGHRYGANSSESM